ncbi:hypothetical protein C7999DRAFT_34589 [Corynascus novoguineensis]|uniref:Uncharacterized protein n=1 Tax=Corynascus novoguineensis TaxID=1126955 RepID=A0AAN7CMV8_9PEZI|nr:hypothetical protein C7999DRAFT_34589 [Corynascus novoguineensis]
MSAVKNLRAMFEQKGEMSPPDRGRSPGIPHGPGSDSPRPLSKIRTSFVAIEKDGRIGLTREGSQDSLPTLRKRSGDSGTTTPVTGAEKQNPFDVLAKSPAKMGAQTQSIFGSPRPSAGMNDVSPLAPAAEITRPKPGSPPAPAAAAEPTKTEADGSEQLAPTVSAATAPAGVSNGTVGEKKEPQKTSAKTGSEGATRTAKSTPKPLAVNSESKSTAKQDKFSKGPTTPAATSTQHPVAKKTPERKANSIEETATPRATPNSKPAGPSSAKRPTPLQSSPAATGFVKPKVKSPTRPVKLPPSLTTHTASSGSKVNVPRQSLSRASGTNLPADTHGRPASRASASTAGSGSNKAAPTKGLRRQSSTISRPRPSLGPPPKQPAKDHPPVKKEKEVDQGFLARMMRPTASSASKAAGKVHTSPPRKAAAAPKKTATVKPARRAVSKPVTPRPSSAVDKVAVAAEHAPTAEEAIEVAKVVENEVSLPADASQKSSASEVTPAPEQSQTVEEAAAATAPVGDEDALPPATEAAAAAAAESQDGNEPEAEQAVIAEEPATADTVDEGAGKAAASLETVAEVDAEAGAAGAAAEKQDAPETTAE